MAVDLSQWIQVVPKPDGVGMASLQIKNQDTMPQALKTAVDGINQQSQNGMFGLGGMSPDQMYQGIVNGYQQNVAKSLEFSKNMSPPQAERYMQGVSGGINGQDFTIPGLDEYKAQIAQQQQQQAQTQQQQPAQNQQQQNTGFDQLAPQSQQPQQQQNTPQQQQTPPPTPPPQQQQQGGLAALSPANSASVQQPTLANVPASVTPPAAPNAVPPPTAGTPPAPTGTNTPATGGTMGDNGYVALLQQYQVNNPNADLSDPAVQDQFNTWAHNNYFVPHGVDNWNDLPTSAFPGFNPQSASNQVFGPEQNFNQTQTANQTGQFQTGNTSAQNQQTTSGQATNQQQVGQTATTQAQNTGQTTNQQQTTGGTTQTSQDQTGTSTTQGTQTTGAVDTLGFGSLLQGAAGGAQTADASRQGFLTDLVDTGGANLNAQFDQGIRQALSGPQTTGAGDSARARMAGYAASDIARNNTNQRLAASQQLAGPTALTQLSTAANPFLGQTSTSTGTNTTTGNTTGTQNQSGFNNLIGSTNTSTQGTSLTDTLNNMASSSSGFQNLASAGSETTAGTATGGSNSSAQGLVPQAQQMSGGGGGCIICTVGIHHSLWRNKRILRKVVRHKLQTAHTRFRNAAAGYFTLFTPVARLGLRFPIVSRVTIPVAKAVVYEELRIAGRCVPFKVWPWVAHWSWHGLCSIAGRFTRHDGLQDKTIIAVAQKHGVYFNIGGK